MVVRYHVSPRLSLVTRMLEVLGTRINHAGFNPGLTFYIARLKNVYVYVTYVYVYVTYVYVYVVLYVCIYIYIYIYLSLSLSLSIYLSACMSVCLSGCLYTCVYIYMWTNQPTCRQMIACVDLCNVLNAYHSGDMTKDYVPATTQNMANTRGTWQG